METKERNASFFRFEDLRIYDKAVDYSSWVSKTLNKKVLATSNNTLKDGFVKGALAICVNIAEGSCRSKSQFEVYLKVAKSAIRECTVYTSVAHKLEIFSDEDYEKSRELLMELTRMLGALIVSLQRTASRRKENQLSELVQDKETGTTSIGIDDESFNLDF